MGRIYLNKNGKTTILTNGEDITSIIPSADTYVVGADLSSGKYEKLNPNGDIIDLEGGGGTPSAPNSSVQYNNAGAFFGDSAFTRNAITKETEIGMPSYATGEITDNGSNDVIWIADNSGLTGNSITLVFNGTDDTDTVLAAWNAANPSNTASVVGGSGNYVPTADIIVFDGGGRLLFVESLDLFGQGGQAAGVGIDTGGGRLGFNGMFTTSPVIIAADLGVDDIAFAQFKSDNIGLNSQRGSNGDHASLILDSYVHSKLKFQGFTNGQSSIRAYDGGLSLTNANYSWYWPTTDGILGQVLSTDGIGGLSWVSGGTPGGSDTWVQYNNAGAFFGDALFTRDSTTKETFIGLKGKDLASNLQITPTGNTLFWDADTTDNIIAKIEQGQNILNAGVKGTSILYGDTVTEEKALIIVGDGTGAGGEPFEISLRTDDGTGNVSTFIAVDSVNGISMGAEDLGVSFIASYADFTLTGNTIQWDADTSDTITTRLEQSQDLFGLGAYSGTGLGWEDFVTNIKGLVVVGDGTAGGRTPGDALITTINTATGDQAAVVTHNGPIEGMSVGVSTQNGNIHTNLSLSSVDGILNYRTEGGVGQEAIVSVTPTETYMTFILDSLSPTYKVSLGNGVFSIDDSVNSILYLDIANGQSIFGNVAAASGITVFVDNANGINIQAPESVINIGANGFGNETNLQVDDSTGIIKASIPAGGDFEVNRLSDNKVAFTVLPDNFFVKLGDCDNIASGTTITVDDSTQLITSSSGGVNKNILVGKTKLLPDNTVTSVFEVALPAGGMTGGFFTATIIATDGTELQAHSDHVTYAAVNKAGVYTTQITNSNTDDAIANSSGTLTITWSIVTGTNKITISVKADSSLPASTITLAGLNIDNNNGHIVTIL